MRATEVGPFIEILLSKGKRRMPQFTDKYIKPLGTCFKAT
jgi:hypothetical protein